MSRRGLRTGGWGVALLIGLAAPRPLFAGDGFTDNFADAPTTNQRWIVPAGEDGSRFAYDGVQHSVLAHYDTGLPTARLIRPLAHTLAGKDSFSLQIAFLIKSANFFHSSTFDAQIAFGLMNQQTTGPDRVGFTSAQKAYDLLTFDYFPNITAFGGPDLGVTIIHSPGQAFFSSIDFPFGSEGELADSGESELPLDTSLVADIKYNPVLKRANLRLLKAGAPLLIDSQGGADNDTTTISTSLTASGFNVDAVGFFLWQDTNPLAHGNTTVRADVVFTSVTFFTPGYGDFDGDSDVDMDDFALFQQCVSGPAIPLAQNCQRFDSDADGDVDQADFGRMQVNFTGSQ